MGYSAFLLPVKPQYNNKSIPFYKSECIIAVCSVRVQYVTPILQEVEVLC